MSDKILIIEHQLIDLVANGIFLDLRKWFWVARTHPEGKIIYGGPENAGDIDGKDLIAVFKAATETAIIVHAPMLEVNHQTVCENHIKGEKK